MADSLWHIVGTIRYKPVEARRLMVRQAHHERVKHSRLN